MKNILFAASECVPFIKTGGLADVCGALPSYINKDEFDVRVILPYYTCIPAKFRDNFKYITHFYMDYGINGNSVHVGIMEYEYNGIKFYFVDNEYYFKCDSPYSSDLKWDIERFTFFCKAVLAILPVIGFRPDIIHCHDWQASLIPVFLHSTFATNPFYSGTKSIMTIHNLKFQGKWSIEDVRNITGLSNYYFTPDRLECNKDANLLKGGIRFADKLNTVSPNYAKEILTPEYGAGLDFLLRERQGDLVGILNGIDTKLWNPSKDLIIPKRYTFENFEEAKKLNKRELRKEFGLSQDDYKPIFSMEK